MWPSVALAVPSIAPRQCCVLSCGVPSNHARFVMSVSVACCCINWHAAVSSPSSQTTPLCTMYVLPLRQKAHSQCDVPVVWHNVSSSTAGKAHPQGEAICAGAICSNCFLIQGHNDCVAQKPHLFAGAFKLKAQMYTQEVVTCMSHVEVLTTRIKIDSKLNQTIKALLRANQGIKVTSNRENQRIMITQLQFDLWPIKIKQERSSILLLIKILIQFTIGSTGNIQVTNPWY